MSKKHFDDNHQSKINDFDIRNFIMISPYNKNVKFNLLKILPELNNIKKFSAQKAAYARMSFNDLKNEVSGDKSSVIMGCIKLLQELDFHIVGCDREELENHVVSDHAFCAALRRYLNINVADLKDKILQMSKERNWLAVRKNGKIVTFYPPIKQEAI